MSEELLSFIWEFRLFDDFICFNFDGENPEIVRPGKLNRNAGPDFNEAKIKMGGTIWAGNIEIHKKSSDWDLHKHYKDKAYNNVLFQVVEKHDKDVYTEAGRLLPVIEIAISDSMKLKYKDYLKNKDWIACARDIRLVDGFKLKMWLANVLIERLNNKSGHIVSLLSLNKNSWEETFYQLLARSFGFKVNADPFEWLAKSTPLKILAKHKTSLFQIEAILFGQAGFLDENCENEYFQQLRNEFHFFKQKFALAPIKKHLWKLLRLRPSNFPHIRIAQFAALIHQSRSLFSKVVEAETIDELKRFFAIKASSFWDEHYTFDKKSVRKPKIFGKTSINSVLINAVIPMLFVYGKQVDNEALKDKAITFLEEMDPEKNNVTLGWERLKISNSSGFYSQALLEQKKTYCDKNRCLKCGIGIEIFKKHHNKS